MDPSPTQFEFNSNHKDTQPTREKFFKNFMQSSQQILIDNVQHSACLDRLATELASGQEKDFFSTQLVPEPTPTQTTSIQEHIHFHEVNKFQTVRSEEQIDDHIDASCSFHRDALQIHSIMSL